MNNAYKTLWSNAKQCFVVTSELATSVGNISSLTLKPFLKLACYLSLPVCSLFSSTLINAAPQNGVVTQGNAAITTQGATTTINQASPKTVINWSSFNIGRSETVNFVQPSTSSVALNRINDSNGSQIMGSLNANGNVFLTNPNGITFAKGAQINVGGLVASTLSISDADFLKGNYQFSATNNKGQINNFAHINANTVALLGNQITNDGWIVANSGDIALVAADDVTIKFGQNQRLGVKVNKGTLNALVDNKQLIQADGGTVLLRAEAADSVFGAAVNNSGTVRAQTLAQVNGEILLLADMQSGTTNLSGTLDASAPIKGDGGFIETSAATVSINSSAMITTLAALGNTGNWLIDPADYIISASGGNITGAALSAELNLTNVTIQTSSYTDVGEPGDIYVNDTVSWTSSNSLTLIAENNIYINKEIKATGDGAGVVFDTALDDTASTEDFINSQHLQLGDEGKVTLLGANALYKLDGKTYQVINGKNTTIDGVTALEELQNINDLLSRNYVLGDDIDATATVTWDGGKGFEPLGGSGTSFSGFFSGAGHSIDQLVIDRPNQSSVGLFGEIESAVIRDVGLTNINIDGESDVAGIVGLQFESSISNSYVTGEISGIEYVGAIAGYQYDSSINDSYSTANVSGELFVGGIVGAQELSSVNNSYSTGNIEGIALIGGIAGVQHESSINNSHSTGNTTGNYVVGGIVGGQIFSSVNSSYSTGNTSGLGSIAGFDELSEVNGIGGIVGVQINSIIDDSYSTGNTTGIDIVGGIVGLSSDFYLGFGECECFEDEVEFEIPIQSMVINSYSTGDTSGEDYIGGIAGILENGIIENSYTTGDVDGIDFVGGIAGLTYSIPIEFFPVNIALLDDFELEGPQDEFPEFEAQSTVIDTYAKGNVTGDSDVGGLIGGAENSRVVTSYSSGTVTGNTNTGGFIGRIENTDIESAYFTESTAQTEGIGEISDSPNVDLTLLSTTESVQMASYEGFDISDEYDAGAVWRIYEGHITPVLTYFLTKVSDFSAQLSTVYSATVVNAPASNISYPDTIDSSQIAGIVNLQTNGADVGNYTDSNLTIDSDLYSTVYDINNASGGDADSSVTITPKILTVSNVEAQDKAFDGNTDAVLTAATLTGVINNDAVNLQTEGDFLTPSVGNDKDVVANYSISNSNYQLANPSEILTADITGTPTVTPVDPNVPGPTDNPNATPEFDANPFGETAAGGTDQETDSQSLAQCETILESIDDESNEEMTETVFNCTVTAGTPNGNT
jgi:filamentous hemagglutinin family protein